MLALLRGFWKLRTAFFKKKWKRSLSFGDCVVDRWERASLLGFGEGTSVYDSSLILGDVVIGKGTWVGPYTILDGSGGRLHIGSNCCISAGVQIYTHDTVKKTVSGGIFERSFAPTSIGDRVYIGPNSVISKGVSIGEEAVVGAFSFVNSNIPDRSLAFGIPCKVRRDKFFEED